MDAGGAYTSHRGEYPGGKPLSALCLAMTRKNSQGSRLEFARLLIDALAAAFEPTQYRDQGAPCGVKTNFRSAGSAIGRSAG